MKKATGYISLHRQILDWEWYRHPHTAFLFIHLLLSANFAEGTYKNDKILRGQTVKTVTALSTETGLSVQTVKTALAHLRLTGEITDDTSRGYRVITITKYDDFQKVTADLTADQPPVNRQPNRQLTADLTADQPPYNNIIINNKKINNKRGRGNATRFLPPTKKEIEKFCKENGLEIDTDRFFDYYMANGWCVGKTKMKDWQAAARNWARRDKAEQKKSAAAEAAAATAARKVIPATDFKQRDYSGVQDELMQQLARDMAAFKTGGGTP